MPTYRTAANTFCTQLVGDGGTGAAPNTAGFVGAATFGWSSTPGALGTPARSDAAAILGPLPQPSTVELDGESAAVSEATGAMSVSRSMTAISASTSSAAAASSITRTIVGAANSNSSAVADLERQRAIAATSSSTSGASASLSRLAGLTGAGDSASAGAAAVSLLEALAATAPAASNATGSLSRSTPLEASSAAISGATGQLSASRSLVAVGVAESGASGQLSRAVGLSADAVAQSSAQASMGIAIALSGSSASVSSAAAVGSVSRAIIGAAASASDADGTVAVLRSLSALAAAQSDAIADMSVDTGGIVALAGSSTSATSATGSAAVTRSLDASGAEQSEAVGSLTVTPSTPVRRYFDIFGRSALHEAGASPLVLPNDGSPQDTSAYGLKLIEVRGDFVATVVIYASLDGVHFVETLTLPSPDTIMLGLAATKMRVELHGHVRGTPEAVVQNVQGLTTAIALPMDTPVDVTALGEYRTVIVGGDFQLDASGLLRVEVSYDAVSWRPGPPFLLRRGRWFFQSNAPYARANAEGVVRGLPVVTIGSIGDL